MSMEHTHFRCAPLNTLERAIYPMRRTGLQSCCAQCGLLRCLSPYLLPLRAPWECQILTGTMAGESTDIILWYWLYKLYTDFITMWSTVECALIRALWS